jgi:hypothetical protein
VKETRRNKPIILKLLREGASIDEISRKVGCTESNISYHRKRAGFPRLNLINHDYIEIQKFYDQGHTVKDVCKKFEISVSVLFLAKERGEFKTRTHDQSRTLSKYPYSRVYFIKCPVTEILFCSPTKVKYHLSASMHIRTYRARASFKFNVYDYPTEFNLKLIKKYGWYSPNGYKKRNKKVNLSGVSRDHLYSILDGFKNNINSKILSHPANCKIVEHYKNNTSKGSKSSITLEELHEKIRLWDKKYPIS